MSSRSGPVAAHNLVFRDGVVSLECAATGAVAAQRAPGDDPAAIGEALRGLAERCDGPVVAVLPAAVFRVAAVRRGRAGRLAARLALARDAGRAPADLAAALGFGPRALVVATGSADRRSRVAAVAVERRTLEEARRYLGAHGLAVAAVRPDPGLLPGCVLPRFPLGAASGSPAASGAPAARRERGVTAVAAWLADRRARVAWPGSLRATLAGGAAAAVLAGALVLAGREAPAPAPDAPVAVLPALPDLADVAEMPVPEATVALRQPPAPKARALPALALLTHDAPRRRPEAPAALPAALAALEESGLAAVASRSVPADIAEDARRAAAAAQARAEATRLAALSPVPRPEPEGSRVEASGGQSDGGPMPRPRPEGAPEAAAAAAAPAAAAASAAPAGAGLRPQPRPLSEAEEVAQAVAAALAAAPVQTAALSPAAAPAAGPRPAPRQAAAIPAAPPTTVRAPAPAAQPVQARPAPAVVRPAPQAAPRQMAALPSPAPAATAPAAAPRVQAPAAAPQRAQPQQAQPQRAQPQPQRQAARPPQPQPQPQRQAAPAAPAASGGSGNITLIGVFGASNQRHALVRLPNGNVQRVRPGETVAGAQVAAVGADNVRIRVNGSDRVLRLPE